MPQSKPDTELLEAALIGFQHRREEVERKIADIRRQLGGQPASPDGTSAAAHTRRTLSASARRRIALAQKKRWAAYKSQHKAAAPKVKKRVLSAAGRARIVAATKKRWAAFRKAQSAK